MATPGLVLVWTGSRPRLTAVPMHAVGGADGPYRSAPASSEIVLGRELLATLGATDDDRVSRRHARVVWCDFRFFASDAGSRNGTWLDGQHRIEAEQAISDGALLRTGRSVWLVCDDVTPFVGATVAERNGLFVGPSSRAAWQRLDALAASGDGALVVGPAGSGRDAMAAEFARATGATPLLDLDLVLDKTRAARLAATTGRIVATSQRLLDDVALPVVEVAPWYRRPEEVAAIIARAAAAADAHVKVSGGVLETVLFGTWFFGFDGIVRDVTAALAAARGGDGGWLRAADLVRVTQIQSRYCVVISSRRRGDGVVHRGLDRIPPPDDG